MTFTLLPDQERMVQKVREKMSSGSRWTLLQMPTGAGKSIVGAEIISNVRKKNKKCLLVVPRIELLKQTAWTLREFNLPFGIIAGGYAMNPFADVHIATTQSLARAIKTGKAPKADLVMLDECHYLAGQQDKIVTHYKEQGAWGIGMSATPMFFSGKGLGCWYDDMVCGESVRWLIENRRLSDYRLFAPNMPDLSGVGSAMGDYKKDELVHYMMMHGKLTGDAGVHYKKYAMGKLAICYTVSVEVAKRTAEVFNAAGIPAASIDGTMNDEQRGVIIRKFARRETLVLTNCDLLTFGFDLKSASGMDAVIEAMIDLKPTKSLALIMQMWGRALRKKDGPALILDHAGNSMVHGLPDDPREWTLEGKNKKSRGISESAMPVKQCNGGWENSDMSGKKMEPCYFVHRPAPRCKNCGAYYEITGIKIETIAGELSETRMPLRALRNDEIAQRDRQIEILIKNGVGKGMPVWAAKKWAAKKIAGELEKKLQRELEISLVIGEKEITI